MFSGCGAFTFLQTDRRFDGANLIGVQQGADAAKSNLLEQSCCFQDTALMMSLVFRISMSFSWYLLLNHFRCYIEIQNSGVMG